MKLTLKYMNIFSFNFFVGLAACCALCFADSGSANKVLLVDDFDRGITVNNLGGIYGGDLEEPGICKVSLKYNLPDELSASEREIDIKGTDVFGNRGASLQLDYDVSAYDTYTYFWMKLGNPYPNDNTNFLPADLTGYDYLSFWIKSRYGFDKVKLELHEDTDGDGKFIWNKDYSSAVYIHGYIPGGISTEWKKVVIPLSNFGNIRVFSRITEIVFVIESKNGNPKGTLFVDNVIFGKVNSGAKSYDSKSKPAAPFEGSITVNGRLLKEGDSVKNGDLITVTAASSLEDVILENVKFEFSDDGRVWQVFGTDYNTEDDSYGIRIDTVTLSGSNLYSFRALAESVDGNFSYIPRAVPDCRVQELTDDEFLDVISKTSFDYFWNEIDEGSGLVKDATGHDYCNIANVGFCLSAYCIGVERGWAEKEEAEKRCLKILDTFLNDVEGAYGFYYHFVKLGSGKRDGNSEVSTIDTAIFLCGVITAGEYFGGEVMEKGNLIIDKVEWDRFINLDEEDPYGHYLNFYHGWRPEGGKGGKFTDYYWDFYSDEIMLVNILALGSREHSVPPESFYSWARRKGRYKDGNEFIYSWHGGLFSYQYAHAWFDFRGIVDREDVDWFENSVDATVANRQFCIDHMSEFSTYGPDSWGVTSFSVKNGDYTMEHGTPPCGSGLPIYEGTVSPSGPAGSMPFTPKLSLHALRFFQKKYPRLWGIYGLGDSMNLDEEWWSHRYYGLGEGITLLAVENYRSGLIWKYFMRSPYVVNGLARAGFKDKASGQILEEDSYRIAGSKTSIKGKNGLSLGELAAMLKSKYLSDTDSVKNAVILLLSAVLVIMVLIRFKSRKK
ncbi:MAG: glucoamylase family protein [bacterium]|nr:glucoamylase family protein [bacterium]